MDLGEKETEITGRTISDFAKSIEVFKDYFDLLPIDLGEKETEITGRIISDFATSIEVYEDYFDLLPQNLCSAITSFLEEPDAAGVESICEELYITGVNYHTGNNPDYFGDNVRSDIKDGHIEDDELSDIASLLGKLSKIACLVYGICSKPVWGAEQLFTALEGVMDELREEREREETKMIEDFAGSIELYEDYFDLLPKNVCSAITSFLKEPDAAGLESICKELYITGVTYHTSYSPDYFGDNVRSDLEDGNIEVEELDDIVSLLDELSYLATTVKGMDSSAALGAERLEKELDKILRDEETRRRER